MYKILGVDGHEYGPVSDAQLKRWIVEGRANAKTKVQPEGSVEWILLGTLPEFADALAGSSPPPPVDAAETQRWAQEVLSGDYQLEIGRCISKGWDLVMKNFWLMVGAFVVAWLISAVGSLITAGPMIGGLCAMYLKQIRRQSATFGDVFVGFTAAFGSLLGAYVVSTLLATVGLILCIAPGIYLAVSWIFALPLIIDKKMDFWSAMELSRKVVTKHWWLMFGFLIVVGLLAIVGVLACIIGVFVTEAIGVAAIMYAYEDIFHPKQESAVVLP